MAGHLKNPFRQLRIGQVVCLQDLTLFLWQDSERQEQQEVEQHSTHYCWWGHICFKVLSKMISIALCRSSGWSFMCLSTMATNCSTVIPFSQQYSRDRRSEVFSMSWNASANLHPSRVVAIYITLGISGNPFHSFAVRLNAADGENKTSMVIASLKRRIFTGFSFDQPL